MRRIILFLLMLVLTTPSFAGMTYSENLPTSTLPTQITPPKSNLFIFDPNNFQWAVYDTTGKRVGLGKAVGGKSFCNDIKKPCQTVEGSYTIFRQGDEECISKTFPLKKGGGAPMPHCMFFYKGYAIHGANHLPDKNVSHGCIRVSKEAAEWMSKNYIGVGSTVLVLPYHQSNFS